MRAQIYKYILNRYAVLPEYPWQKFPEYAVFRHGDNQKWFALIANVGNSKLGLGEHGETDLLNLKLPPDLVDTLKLQKGFLPAYHMNKRTWLSVLLDGSVSFAEVCTLLDESFQITASKKK